MADNAVITAGQDAAGVDVVEHQEHAPAAPTLASLEAEVAAQLEVLEAQAHAGAEPALARLEAEVARVHERLDQLEVLARQLHGKALEVAADPGRFLGDVIPAPILGLFGIKKG